MKNKILIELDRAQANILLRGIEALGHISKEEEDIKRNLWNAIFDAGLNAGLSKELSEVLSGVVS
tara:strand:+ start:194 stop:388 length:195 start_codon:yes stop_codon:yes gene_type:complete